MKKIFKKATSIMIWALPLMATVSCSDAYMEEVNSNKTKSETMNPNYLLTTGLLQTYGDISVKDTWRCFVMGYTQHYSGIWNTCNYAGANNADNSEMSKMWSRYYGLAIKNLVDAERLSQGSPTLNAMIRIHKAYLLATLTDTYGDIPCSEAGKGYISGVSTPKYDKQEDIYKWLFKELDECEKQLGTSSEPITGDVTAYNGNAAKWKKYANSLRLRYAMRISDVDPELAMEEWNKAIKTEGGVMTSADDDAYIKYADVSFTLYDGAKDYDIRANALSELNYSQDSKSPALICSTFYEMMKQNDDPRLYRICRHYVNGERAKDKTDLINNIDITGEVINYQNSQNRARSWALRPGEVYYEDWVEVGSEELWEKYFPVFNITRLATPAVMNNDSNSRMLHPWLSLKFERASNPGILMTYAEVEFLMAEAALKDGWTVTGSAASHYENGIKAAMKMLNTLYAFDSLKDDAVAKDQISDNEISAYITAHPLSSDTEKAKEQINTEAWLLHFNNPMEAWANMRRSDYPYIIDRTSYTVTQFSEASDMRAPTRLKYPTSEFTENAANYKEALDRMGGSDDWHKLVWWDVKENNHFKTY